MAATIIQEEVTNQGKHEWSLDSLLTQGGEG
jgi:hypothetical protein